MKRNGFRIGCGDEKPGSEKNHVFLALTVGVISAALRGSASMNAAPPTWKRDDSENEYS